MPEFYTLYSVVKAHFLYKSFTFIADVFTTRYGHIISDFRTVSSSNRTVDLTYGALIWLSALKHRNEELHIPGNHIVCTKSGRIPSQNEISDRLRYFCKVIGVEYKASHSCRRYYATSMLESGIALPQVSSDLGHADAATTHKFYNKIKEKDTSKIMKQKNKVQRRQFGNLATHGNTPNCSPSTKKLRRYVFSRTCGIQRGG